jgi:DNA-binding NarL/FixJ family response regulator
LRSSRDTLVSLLTRVLLADDHSLVRAGIRALLNEIPGLQVVAEAADGREALDLARIHRPNLVLMDISMRGLNGIEATSQLRRDLPDVRVIILSMHASEEYVTQALRAGASGYMLKDSATQELALAIAAVMRGEAYLSPSISKQLVERYVQGGGVDTGPLDVLTSRQREILQLIAEGRSTKEIAHLLHLSVKTVESHRSQLMERLEIHDIPGLVRYALRVGLVQQDQ